jgi:hypothetical protein
MPTRDRDMLERRIAGETLEEIGKSYSVTRERVRQIEVKWRLKGLIVPDARPLTDASARLLERKPRPGNPPKRKNNLSEAERERRAEHMRAVSAKRWAEARA